ncbi:MAG: hypothetical protein ACI8X5_002154 [Planctomycetota bacterium]|jgi:hypothetical protein
MSKNSVLVIGIIVALAFVGYLTLGGGAEAALDELEAEGEQDHSALEVDEPPVSMPAVVESELEVPIAATVQAEREEITVALPVDQVPVLVRGPNGPLANFEVWAITEAHTHTAREFQDPMLADQLVEERGEAFTTSAQGIVSFPAVEGWTVLVLGRAEGLWGSLIIPRGTQEQQLLELTPDFSYRARVVGADDQPIAGVPVKIRYVDDGGARELQQAVTKGEPAIASFVHAQNLKIDRDGGYLIFEVDALTAKPVTLKIDYDQGPSEIATLHLPATGRVAVSVLDEKAAPIPDGQGRVTLSYIPPGENRVSSPFSQFKRTSVSRNLKGSKVEFEHVELGIEVGAAVERTHSSIPSRAFSPGPRVSGETVAMEVQIGTDHPVLSLRAINAAGIPFADTSVRVGVKVTGQTFMGTRAQTVRTDEHGRFVVDVARLAPDTALNLDFKAYTGDGAVASLKCSEQLVDGPNELGDVVLEPAKVFLRGRCVTEKGEPIAFVQLAMRSTDSSPDNWMGQWRFNMTADQDGSFEVTEVFSGSAFQLAGEKDGYGCKWQNFAPGQQNMTLVMLEEAKVTGRVLLDDQIPKELVLIKIGKDPSDSEHRFSGPSSGSLEEDGSFVIGGLTDSTRTVTVGIQNQAGELAVFENVFVRAGDAAQDPRLAAIDLRGKLFAHELELIGRTPGERLQGSVAFGPSGSEEPREKRRFHQGTVRLLTSSERLDARVMVSGYRTEDLTNFSGEKALNLRAGLSVTLVLLGGAELPSEPTFLKAMLLRTDKEPGSMDYSGSSFDQKREITIRIPDAGRMKVQWLVSRVLGAGGAIGMPAEIEREQIIHVQDTDSNQRFEVSLSQEEMDVILEKLNR